MGRSGFHEALEATAPDHWASRPLDDETIDWLLDGIEHDLENDPDDIVSPLLFRDLRKHHVITADLRAAIGRVVHMIRADENVEITDADLALLAKIAEGAES